MELHTHLFTPSRAPRQRTAPPASVHASRQLYIPTLAHSLPCLANYLKHPVRSEILRKHTHGRPKGDGCGHDVTGNSVHDWPTGWPVQGLRQSHRSHRCICSCVWFSRIPQPSSSQQGVPSILDVIIRSSREVGSNSSPPVFSKQHPWGRNASSLTAQCGAQPTPSAHPQQLQH
jgi:hypothetical protein